MEAARCRYTPLLAAMAASFVASSFLDNGGNGETQGLSVVYLKARTPRFRLMWSVPCSCRHHRNSILSVSSLDRLSLNVNTQDILQVSL